MKKIKVGTFTTKEMVELFGTSNIKKTYEKQKQLKGGNKETVLKNASLVCDIEQLGDGVYKVINVFDKPLPTAFNKLKQGMYQYISPIILSKLLSEHDENNKITLPLMEYARYIEMINQNYIPFKHNQTHVSKLMNIWETTTYEFFEKVDDGIAYYIQNALKLLQEADVLKWYKVPMIRKKKIEVKMNTKGTPIIDCLYEDRRATSDEFKLCNDIFEKVRHELEIEKRQECFYGKRAKVFWERLNELLKEEDILYFYDSYEIYYTNRDRCQNLFNAFKCDESQMIEVFNDKFIELIVNNAEKRLIKSLEKQEKFKDIRNNDEVLNSLSNHKYIADFKTLSETTIHKDTEKIKFSDGYNEKIKEKRIEQLEDDFEVKVYKKYKNNTIIKTI